MIQETPITITKKVTELEKDFPDLKFIVDSSSKGERKPHYVRAFYGDRSIALCFEGLAILEKDFEQVVTTTPQEKELLKNRLDTLYEGL